MRTTCCCHQAAFQNLAVGLLAPGNSESAVLRLTEMIEMCRACNADDCPGIGEMLIQATVMTAVEQCDENATKPGLLDGLLPGPRLAEDV